MRFLSTLLVLIVYIAGCSWLPQNDKPQIQVPNFFQEGKVVDTKRLAQGGKLLIIPFRPGSNIAYDESFEKISLMIARGIVDVLNDADTSFELLNADNADEADLILEGHVVELKDVSTVKKWVMLSDAREMAIRGKIIDRNTGNSIVVFTSKRESKKKNMDYRKLGHIIGQDVGRYILSGIE